MVYYKRGGIMKIFSIIVGKITAYLCGLIGRGSSFPGKVASVFNKSIIKKLQLPDKIIIVTGSSGKGSTTKLIANTFEDFGYTVVHNKEGGNLKNGIITVLIKNATLTGKIKKDVLVLEVDERYLKFITEDLKPTDLVITNITRDQPPRQGHIDLVIDEIKKGIADDVHLYLNANDPILQEFVINRKNKITYYGIEKLKTSYEKKLFNTLNSLRCPKCNNILDYEYYHIEDIGKYSCKKCKLKTPNAKYKITDFNKNILTIDNKYKVTLNNDMLYNLFNTIAAYSVLKEYKLNSEKIALSISNQNKNNKIYNKYRYNERDIYVLNNKAENSSTYNQSILYTYNDKNEKTIVLGWEEISRRYIWDDISWLYDIEFELLKDADLFIVAGPQRYDLATRLKYAGIDEKRIKIHKDLYSAKGDIQNSKGSIYAILNFDYLNDFNTVMEELK